MCRRTARCTNCNFALAPVPQYKDTFFLNVPETSNAMLSINFFIFSAISRCYSVERAASNSLKVPSKPHRFLELLVSFGNSNFIFLIRNSRSLPVSKRFGRPLFKLQFFPELFVPFNCDVVPRVSDALAFLSRRGEQKQGQSKGKRVLG